MELWDKHLWPSEVVLDEVLGQIGVDFGERTSVQWKPDAFSQQLFLIGCFPGELFDSERGLRWKPDFHWQPHWPIPRCILLLATVIKKHPRWNLSSPDKLCRTAPCKAKLCGSWMRDFCLETRGTWPWHILAWLYLTSDCHLLSPNQQLTL